MVAHDFTYPLGHIVTGSFWHNLKESSLHLTIADTGWGKAVWGKLYGQWIAGANVFVYDHEKFTPAAILEKIQDYHVTSLCAPPTIFRFLIHEDLTKYDLSSLEYCTIAGEALNPAIRDLQETDGHQVDGGFRTDRNDPHRRHHALDGTETRQHGIAQSAIRRRPDRQRRPFCGSR